MGGASYAYVTVLGLGKNRLIFRNNVKLALDVLNLKLMRLEEVESLYRRQKSFEMDSKLEKGSNLLSNKKVTFFGDFFTYDEK